MKVVYKNMEWEEKSKSTTEQEGTAAFGIWGTKTKIVCGGLISGDYQRSHKLESKILGATYFKLRRAFFFSFVFPTSVRHQCSQTAAMLNFKKMVFAVGLTWNPNNPPRCKAQHDHIGCSSRGPALQAGGTEAQTETGLFLRMPVQAEVAMAWSCRLLKRTVEGATFLLSSQSKHLFYLENIVQKELSFKPECFSRQSPPFMKRWWSFSSKQTRIVCKKRKENLHTLWSHYKHNCL